MNASLHVVQNWKIKCFVIMIHQFFFNSANIRQCQLEGRAARDPASSAWPQGGMFSTSGPRTCSSEYIFLSWPFDNLLRVRLRIPIPTLYHCFQSYLHFPESWNSFLLATWSRIFLVARCCRILKKTKPSVEETRLLMFSIFIWSSLICRLCTFRL